MKKPNNIGVDWVCSVPCGQQEKKEAPCESWIFLIVPEESWDGPQKKQWVSQYLDELQWVLVSKKSKRFICPECSKGEL